jgi:hypothetical protein
MFLRMESAGKRRDNEGYFCGWNPQGRGGTTGDVSADGILREETGHEI